MLIYFVKFSVLFSSYSCSYKDKYIEKDNCVYFDSSYGIIFPRQVKKFIYPTASIIDCLRASPDLN